MITKIDIQNINDVHKKIVNNFNDLLVMLNNYKERIEDISSMCDTPTGNTMRSVLKEYMEYSIAKTNNEFSNCLDKLTDIEKIYDDTIDHIEKSINGA